MKKLVWLPALLLIGFMQLAFTTNNNSLNIENSDGIGYLPSLCDAPIYFQIESQEPCAVLEVNPDTGKLSLIGDGSTTGICGTIDSKRSRVKVKYSVTNADGVRYGNFIIIDLEEEE